MYCDSMTGDLGDDVSPQKFFSNIELSRSPKIHLKLFL